ncbi:hypothetical protein MRB53_010672 [Persea americana]|uniref:Uncharacterized protein n=1 Tax=Persea americana TaxID=3435 RepID=A0ACC2LSH0_PERAE|nr:hypothetical protein MRB53_010672 [Persea americana]
MLLLSLSGSPLFILPLLLQAWFAKDSLGGGPSPHSSSTTAAPKPNSSSLTTPNIGPHPSGFIPNLDPLYDNHVMSLPSGTVYGILEKFPAPNLDCSNPFSILEFISGRSHLLYL